jgi:retinol dehydrogenase-12
MGALLGTAQQLFYKPPFPAADFSGKTIIITGSNTGLGKDAVEHFARLKSERIIIAVRSLAKGEAVKAELEAKCKPEGSIDVWELDYSKYASVKAFVAKAATLDRIDAAILNAGVATEKFELFEEDESQVTVNVVSTMLLALLLLPVLRKVASKHHIVPVISVTSSAAHNFAINFRERTAENIFQALNDEKKTVMPEQ